MYGDSSETIHLLSYIHDIHAPGTVYTIEKPCMHVVLYRYITEINTYFLQGFSICFFYLAESHSQNAIVTLTN